MYMYLDGVMSSEVKIMLEELFPVENDQVVTDENAQNSSEQGDAVMASAETQSEGNVDNGQADQNTNDNGGNANSDIDNTDQDIQNNQNDLDEKEKLKRSLHASRADVKKYHKRLQDVETQLSQFRNIVSGIGQQNQQAQQQVKTPDIDADNYFQGPDAVKAYIEHHVNSVKNESQIRFNRLSAAAARHRYDDYDEVVSSYKMPASIQQEVLDSDDPGDLLYQYAKASREFEGVRDVKTYREKIEQELREKLEAEYASKYQNNNQQQIKKPNIPQSLASARGNGAGKPATWGGPTPFEDIIPE
jgi:hypothetical protein